MTTEFVRGVAEAPPTPPARSPERQRLASAITVHRQISEAHNRVSLAIDRLRSERVEKHHPALALAREALQNAEAERPHQLVDQLLDNALVGDESGADPVTDAQIAVSEAQRKIEECRQSIQLLETELATRERSLNMAASELDHAVAAVITNDPRKQELHDEFFATGRHLLRLAQIGRTLGIMLTGVEHEEIGLVLRVTDRIRTGYGSTGASAFRGDPEFSSAMIDLHCDADVQLPDLPNLEYR